MVMIVTRTLWRDHQLGQVWALEEMDGRLAGCAGPLTGGVLSTDELNNLCYERDPGLLRWITGRRRSSAIP
jgi:hypothetical protein